ncbi:unnamed protein product [Dibothriocephalus latus]|uniref:Uncharacterized protein n=1 Tax=Dibothriocephalus latus TaxID=60516 RepID=A0A3P7LEQ5_DIBLA|nr:unnamed protein product [Dibothriocephalus latus]
MRLYTSVKRIWEAQIKAIQAGKSPKDIKKLAAHLHIPPAPSEVDANQIKTTSLAKIAFDVTSEFYWPHSMHRKCFTLITPPNCLFFIFAHSTVWYLRERDQFAGRSEAYALPEL